MSGHIGKPSGGYQMTAPRAAAARCGQHFRI
jgi:hypothetical protein